MYGTPGGSELYRSAGGSELYGKGRGLRALQRMERGTAKSTHRTTQLVGTAAGQNRYARAL